MQKIRLDIPIEPYLLCMTRFGINSPEYIKLKNGVVLRDSDGNEIVEILCEHDRAKKILEMTAQLCPEAFPQIKPRIDFSDTSDPQQSQTLQHLRLSHPLQHFAHPRFFEREPLQSAVCQNANPY